MRYGEPNDHEYAVYRVLMWLSDNYVRIGSLKGNKVSRTYSTKKECYYPQEFRVKKDYPLKHKPDITLYSQENDEVLGFIEIDGKIGIEYTGLDGKKHKSSPTKHDKPSQKKNDHIFEEYARRYHNVEVIRLMKEEILGEEEDREKYLKKHLKVLLK
jgi:hypothetical protein